MGTLQKLQRLATLEKALEGPPCLTIPEISKLLDEKRKILASASLPPEELVGLTDPMTWAVAMIECAPTDRMAVREWFAQAMSYARAEGASGMPTPQALPACVAALKIFLNAADCGHLVTIAGADPKTNGLEASLNIVRAALREAGEL